MLELAMEAIDRGGEVAVRVSDVAAGAETAITSLYHHFGSREGLIEEAQVERIVRGYRLGTEDFRRAVEECRTRAQFRAIIVRMIEEASSPERMQLRLARANAIGSAFGRPGLFRRIADVLDRVDEDRAEILAMAQRRGWVQPDLDMRVASTWYACLVFGRALADFERPSCDPRKWLDLTIEVSDRLLFGPSGARGARPAARTAKGAVGGGGGQAGAPRAVRAPSPPRTRPARPAAHGRAGGSGSVGKPASGGRRAR